MRTGMKMLAMNALRNNARNEGYRMEGNRMEGNRMEGSRMEANGYGRMESNQYGRMEANQYGRGEMRYEMEGRNEMRSARNEMRYPRAEMYEERMEMFEQPQSRRRRYENGRFAPSSNNEQGRMEMNRMDRIGFEMNYNMRPEMEQEYRADAEYPRMEEMGYRSSGEKQRGHAKGGMMQELDQKTAKQWVESMQNDEGRKGSRWNEMQAESIMKQTGIKENPTEFYAMINAMYSDYAKVAKEFGVDRPDFYAKMAEAWINDKDAVEGKTAVYYECCVKH